MEVSSDSLSRSAKSLFIRSLSIRPLGAGLFIYVDSGSKEAFGEADRQVFEALGGLLAQALAEVQCRPARSGGLIGTSAAMAGVRDLAARYAVEEEPVLIVGETGVGKNRVAELIHKVSGRRGPFVVAHIPSLPEDLVERELFGHRRGAFTGAGSDRPGLFDEAQDGTLLLDEITEVPLAVQAKLLRVVESRRFRPWATPRNVKPACGFSRPPTATSRSRCESVAFERICTSGSASSDSASRRCGNALTTSSPSPENARLLRGKTLGPAAERIFAEHSWPGNARELLHVLTRAGIELDSPVLGEEVRSLVPTNHDSDGTGHDPLASIRTELASGGSFWDVTWPAFLERDLNREQMTLLLRQGFEACGGSL